MVERIVDEVHSLKCSHIRDMLTQNPHSVECSLVVEQVITTSAALYKVDSREYSLVGKRTIELELHIASTFKFLEDYLIHLAAGIDKSSSNNSK